MEVHLFNDDTIIVGNFTELQEHMHLSYWNTPSTKLGDSPHLPCQGFHNWIIASVLMYFYVTMNLFTCIYMYILDLK